MAEEEDMRDIDLMSEGVDENQRTGIQQALADADGDDEEEEGSEDEG
ncbi:MAG TPA: hypothetical protein VHA05_00225 [Candidatus Saccharimonadales bacterium]|nr:hypothetical protein [Candidatus Saccharimonadales bacterium]